MVKQSSVTSVPWRLLAGVILVSLVMMIYFFVKPGPRAQFVLVVNLMGIFFPLGLGVLYVKGTCSFLRLPVTPGSLPDTF